MPRGRIFCYALAGSAISHTLKRPTSAYSLCTSEITSRPPKRYQRHKEAVVSTHHLTYDQARTIFARHRVACIPLLEHIGCATDRAQRGSGSVVPRTA